MAISNLLQVYRESLASERQSRRDEISLQLSALQFEASERASRAEEVFRQEGRQRENALFALAEAKKTTSEAQALDAITGYQKLLTIEQVSEYLDDDLSLKKPTKVVGNLVSEAGFTQDEATQIVNIVSSYSNEATRPAGQKMMKDFSDVISRDYEIWKRSGFNKDQKSALMQSLEKSGVMYSTQVDGFVDAFQRDISVDAFIGVSQADNLLNNIGQEISEIGIGDYTIDRQVVPSEDVVDAVGTSIDLLALDLENQFAVPREDYIANLEQEVRTEISGINTDIEDLNNLIKSKEEEILNTRFDFKRKKIDSKTGLPKSKSSTDSEVKQLNKEISDAKKQIQAFESLESEARERQKEIKEEKTSRMLTTWKRTKPEVPFIKR